MSLLYTPKLGGWKPATELKTTIEDVLDLKFHDHVEKFNAKISASEGVIDLRQWCSPVEDQGQIGSCVGNGVVGALEFLQIRNGQQYVDLSRLFVYYNSRLMTQDQEHDSGTYIHVAFSTLSKLGTCTEKMWPYDINQTFVRPTWNSYREAYPNKISSYYQISGYGKERIELIRSALHSQHPVVFGMLVDLDYMNYRGGIVEMPKSVRRQAGHHCQMIVGDDSQRRLLIIRNSWGKYWGDGGYAYVPYDYLDESEANDFWVPYIEDASTQTIDIQGKI